MKYLPPRIHPLTLAALAPVSWGTTYIVTAHLEGMGPLTLATLRALLAGLVLLALVRRLPTGAWWWKSLVLGALNFGLFFAALFVSAQKLPGAVAPTLGAVQPLLVIALTLWWLDERPSAQTVGRALLGLVGVALLVLGPVVALDRVGLIAGFLSVVSTAVGFVLAGRWGAPAGTPLLAVTAWQLTAGGLLLLPVAALSEGPLPNLSGGQWALLAYMVLIATALAYALWFRGIAHGSPVGASLLSRLSPATAILIDVALGRTLGAVQWGGLALIALSFLPERPRPSAAPVLTGRGKDAACPR